MIGIGMSEFEQSEQCVDSFPDFAQEDDDC
jgi:hypothetical protein